MGVQRLAGVTCVAALALCASAVADEPGPADPVASPTATAEATATPAPSATPVDEQLPVPTDTPTPAPTPTAPPEVTTIPAPPTVAVPTPAPVDTPTPTPDSSAHAGEAESVSPVAPAVSPSATAAPPVAVGTTAAAVPSAPPARGARAAAPRQATPTPVAPSACATPVETVDIPGVGVVQTESVDGVCRVTSAGCTILGTDGDDVLTGSPIDDVICGFGGNDRIDGAGGHDLLFGGEGDDVLIGGAGYDCMIGGPGTDRAENNRNEFPEVESSSSRTLDSGEIVQYYGAYTVPAPTYCVPVRVGAVVSYPPGALAVAPGPSGCAAPVETLDEEQVVSPSADGSCRLSSAACTIVGTDGADDLTGTPGADVICGMGGNDRLDGRGGNDVLLGGAGNDVMVGGRGAGDCMVGGPGSDKAADNTADETPEAETTTDLAVRRDDGSWVFAYGVIFAANGRCVASINVKRVAVSSRPVKTEAPRPTSPTRAATPPTVTAATSLSAAPLRLDLPRKERLTVRRDRVRVRVTCSASTPVELVLVAGSDRIAHKRFTCTPPGTTVRVKLNAAGRKLLARDDRVEGRLLIHTPGNTQAEEVLLVGRPG
jgi:hypothetical protein